MEDKCIQGKYSVDIFLNIIYDKLNASDEIFEYVSLSEIITKIMEHDDRYYIHKCKFVDLEGVGKKLFGNNFGKRTWIKSNASDIKNKIRKNINKTPLKQLRKFLEN